VVTIRPDSIPFSRLRIRVKAFLAYGALAQLAWSPPMKLNPGVAAAMTFGLAPGFGRVVTQTSELGSSLVPPPLDCFLVTSVPCSACTACSIPSAINNDTSPRDLLLTPQNVSDANQDGDGCGCGQRPCGDEGRAVRMDNGLAAQSLPNQQQNQTQIS
jgi:hypothetical protein